MNLTLSKHLLSGAAVFAVCTLGPVAALTAQQPDYADVDRHALAAPAAAEQSLEGLARYLTAGLKTDREKARAIFRWVAANISYDTQSFFSGNVRTATPAAEVLRTRKAVCDGYAELVMELGRLSGLRVEKIEGYAKGFGHRTGARFDRTNHAWNAVRIDSRWQLMDATWAAGHIDGTTYVQAFDDYWFLPVAEQFIFTHLPAERKWQLQRQKLSLRAFEQQVSLRHTLFRVGFPAAEIRTRARARTFRGFADVYEHSGSRFSIISAPIDQFLRSGAEYTFTLDAPGADEVVVIHAGEWQKLARKGNLFSGSILARGGELGVTVRVSGQEPQYVLRYQVEGR